MDNTSTTTTAQGIARMPEVMRMVGLSKPSIYRMIAAGKFPASVPLGDVAVGWLRAEVAQWIAERVSERGARIAEAA